MTTPLGCFSLSLAVFLQNLIVINFVFLEIVRQIKLLLKILRDVLFFRKLTLESCVLLKLFTIFLLKVLEVLVVEVFIAAKVSCSRLIFDFLFCFFLSYFLVVFAFRKLLCVLQVKLYLPWFDLHFFNLPLEAFKLILLNRIDSFFFISQLCNFFRRKWFLKQSWWYDTWNFLNLSRKLFLVLHYFVFRCNLADFFFPHRYLLQYCFSIQIGLLSLTVFVGCILNLQSSKFMSFSAPCLDLIWSQKGLIEWHVVSICRRKCDL